MIGVLSSEERLVILDNCEQVLDGCRAMIDALVRACHEIRVMSTSRQPMRIDGEAVYRVPSLSLPPQQVRNRSDLEGSEAVALFVERAAG